MGAFPGINKQNAMEANCKSLELRQNLGPKPILQAIELQAIAMRDCRDEKTAPHIRAALMRAWCDLEERKRILRMKPKPRDIDVSKPRKSSRKPAAFVELPQAPEPPNPQCAEKSRARVVPAHVAHRIRARKTRALARGVSRV